MTEPISLADRKAAVLARLARAEQERNLAELADALQTLAESMDADYYPGSDIVRQAAIAQSKSKHPSNPK